MTFFKFSNVRFPSISFSSRIYIVIFFIASFIFIVSSCVFNADYKDQTAPIEKDGNTLVGSTQCKKCHATIYDQFVKTAHSKTSMPANKHNVKGSFKEGENSYVFSYYDGVMMQDLDSGLYQVNFLNRKFDKAYKFDIVIGSGTRGQSYLHWNENRLFQLPISYFTTSNSWSNSPGYADDFANFGRPIGSQCMGCHSSYVDVISDEKKQFEEFDKSNIVYGINCEKCHGAGGKHVDLFTANPTAKGDKLIVNASNLSQSLQLDACAVCHSSNAANLKPALYFKTGDSLDHSHIQTNQQVKVDVHGNQYGLLIESKCFVKSTTMTCSTCHNPHEQQRGDLAMFSQKCMQCHTPEKANFCKMTNKMGVAALQKNCIDCHMQNKESQMLNVKLDPTENHSPAVIRSHLIAVHPEGATKISEMFLRETSTKPEKNGRF